MKKMSRGAANIFAVFFFCFLLGLTITIWHASFFGSVIVKLMLTASDIILVFAIINDLWKWSEANTESIDYVEEKHYGALKFLYANYEGSGKSISMTKWFWYSILFVVFILTVKLSNVVWNGSVFVYNQDKVFHYSYNQKGQELVIFYDKQWKTFKEKKNIRDDNNEMCLTVAKIVMGSRKDGDKITWKWVSENQNIPFEEFTSFSKDLSSFIEEQRKGYYEIEKERQIIAQKQNILLDTFPNNIYNKIIGCEKITNEPGFTSDSTKKIFKLREENIK